MTGRASGCEVRIDLALANADATADADAAARPSAAARPHLGVDANHGRAEYVARRAA
ncbi:hypothetical protein [Dactylosporangium salmoneum]|uniref:Uncharacterized protein n=1 Tax=Dactylosporangium salmoneum TaxID=53361 RepID=A0ABP5USN9_9ACTN